MVLDPNDPNYTGQAIYRPNGQPMPLPQPAGQPGQPPVTPNIAPPAPPPAAPPPTPNPPPPSAPNTSTPLSTFGPGNDLQSTQINPVDNADTVAARGLISSNLNQVSGAAPDRMALALDNLKTFDQNQADSEKLGVQDIGREAAAAGRLGSGMVSTSLGDLQTQLGKQRDQYTRGLINDASGLTLQDRLSQLNAAEGATGELGNMDTNARNELRGERGYQSDQSQQALQNRVNEKALEDSLLNSQYGRNMETAQFEQGMGDTAGAQSAAAGAGAGSLLSQMSLEQYLKQHPELAGKV